MAFLDLQLHLVNRTLRRAGQREAMEREEGMIRSLAAQGVPTDVIAAYVRAER